MKENKQRKNIPWKQFIFLFAAITLLADLPPAPSGCASPKNSSENTQPQPVEEDPVPSAGTAPPAVEQVTSE